MNQVELNVKLNRSKDTVSIFVGENADRFDTCELYKNEKDNSWKINFAYGSTMDVSTAKKLNYLNTIGVLLADKLTKNFEKEPYSIINEFMKGQK